MEPKVLQCFLMLPPIEKEPMSNWVRVQEVIPDLGCHRVLFHYTHFSTPPWILIWVFGGSHTNPDDWGTYITAWGFMLSRK